MVHTLVASQLSRLAEMAKLLQVICKQFRKQNITEMARGVFNTRTYINKFSGKVHIFAAVCEIII